MSYRIGVRLNEAEYQGELGVKDLGVQSWDPEA